MHGCAGFPIADERRYGTYVLSTILGGGMSSRLFQNVREKHGLAYSVFSELNLYRDSGCLAVYAGTSPENLKKVILMVVDEFRQMCTEEVPAEELRRAKDHLKGSPRAKHRIDFGKNVESCAAGTVLWKVPECRRDDGRHRTR